MGGVSTKKQRKPDDDKEPKQAKQKRAELKRKRKETTKLLIQESAATTIQAAARGKLERKKPTAKKRQGVQAKVSTVKLSFYEPAERDKYRGGAFSAGLAPNEAYRGGLEPYNAAYEAQMGGGWHTGRSDRKDPRSDSGFRDPYGHDGPSYTFRKGGDGNDDPDEQQKGAGGRGERSTEGDRRARWNLAAKGVTVVQVGLHDGWGGGRGNKSEDGTNDFGGNSGYYDGRSFVEGTGTSHGGKPGRGTGYAFGAVIDYTSAKLNPKQSADDYVFTPRLPPLSKAREHSNVAQASKDYFFGYSSPPNRKRLDEHEGRPLDERKLPSSARLPSSSLEASPRGGFGRDGLYGHYGRLGSNRSFMYKHRLRPARSHHAYPALISPRPPLKPVGKYVELAPVRVPQVGTAPVPKWLG